MDPVAKKIIKTYKLSNNSKILDVGCGKGFLLYEIKKSYLKLRLLELISQAMELKTLKKK